MFSDDIRGRLKASASTKLKVETASRQSSNRVRTAHTLHVGFEAPCNSLVGCVAQPRTRSVGYAGYGLLVFIQIILCSNDRIFCLYISILDFIFLKYGIFFLSPVDNKASDSSKNFLASLKFFSESLVLYKYSSFAL